MVEKERWIVTYTKHIKQKRKVYHDGFLDFQMSSRKVMLYDEAGNQLESRILKTDEVVSSGETLIFQAYLVDILEPNGENKASSNSKVQPSDQGGISKSFSVLRPNFKKCALRCEERQSNSMNKFPAKNLSPSHKMIRVFKKREMQKYGALSPGIVKPSIKGTVSAVSVNKKVGLSNDNLSINPHDGKPPIDSSSESNKSTKSVPSHKPLRDAKQILSILQKPPTTVGIVAEKNPDNNSLQRSASPKRVPSESGTSKIRKIEAASSEAPGDKKINKDRDIAESSQVVLLESSSDGSNAHLADPPSFDLGI